MTPQPRARSRILRCLGMHSEIREILFNIQHRASRDTAFWMCVAGRRSVRCGAIRSNFVYGWRSSASAEGGGSRAVRRAVTSAGSCSKNGLNNGLGCESGRTLRARCDQIECGSRVVLLVIADHTSVCVQETNTRIFAKVLFFGGCHMRFGGDILILSVRVFSDIFQSVFRSRISMCNIKIHPSNPLTSGTGFV